MAAGVDRLACGHARDLDAAAVADGLDVGAQPDAALLQLVAQERGSVTEAKALSFVLTNRPVGFVITVGRGEPYASRRILPRSVRWVARCGGDYERNLADVFLLDLSDDQKRAFPALATAIVHADGRASVPENALMARLQVELGPEMASISAIDEALAAFGDAPARRIALLELVGVAWCDGDVADAEAALLDRFADEWLIGSEERTAIFNWVERQTSLLAEADRLIHG